MRRSFLAALAPFAVAATSLIASPLGCAKGLNSSGADTSDVGGAGGQGGATSVAESSSASTGGGVCDDTGTCETCRSCAITGQCSSQHDTCLGDPECLDYDDCISACPNSDSACYDSCGVQYPFGQQEFFEYALCLICGACYNDCEGTPSTCTI